MKRAGYIMADGALRGLLLSFCLDLHCFFSYITHPYIHHPFSLYKNINRYSRKILITGQNSMQSGSAGILSLDVNPRSSSCRTTCTCSRTRSYANSPDRGPFPSNHVLTHVIGPSSRYSHEQQLSFVVPRPRRRDLFGTAHR